MNILFDLISTQGSINGGAEYTIKIFTSLLERYDKSKNEIIALYDSRISNAYDQVSPQYVDNELNIRCIDISNELLFNIIKKYQIDVFFIGIGQRFENYYLQNINCRVICVIHDLSLEEIKDNKLSHYMALGSWTQITKYFLRNWINQNFKKNTNYNNKNLFNFIQKHNVEIVTVSEYSKHALLYYCPKLSKNISVLFSPEKSFDINQDIENSTLKRIIDQKLKYFLLIGADRIFKNVDVVIKVFERFLEFNPDYYIVTIGNSKIRFNNHITLPYLSASDLENTYKHSYAFVYPSLYEGFGYPPVEAMKYNKPILSSNVCSMPEILGTAPLYFSPYYKTDVFKAFNYCIERYQELSDKSRIQYLVIKELQSKSLSELLDMILSKL